MRFFTHTLPVFATGCIVGAAGWYLASPLWIDNVVSEQLPASLMVQTVATGSFSDADRAHKGTGNAVLLATQAGEHLLRLTDFEVTNGPDLEVWLSASADPRSSADVKAVAFESLGQLKGNIGDQTYVVPADVDLSQFKSVVIWCEQFGVLFSPAPLMPAS